MTTYWFTLRFDGEAAASETFSNALYEDGRDCIIASMDGVVTAAYHREAASLRDAVLSAIASVHRADQSVRIVALEIDGDQTIDEAFAA